MTSESRHASIEEQHDNCLLGHDIAEQVAELEQEPTIPEPDFSSVVVRKPWGYEYLIYQTQNIAVWLLHISPGASTSLHYHPHKVTELIVLSGQVELSGDRPTVELFERDGAFIPLGSRHRTREVGGNGAVLLEVESPNKKHDLVRVSDDYGRSQEAYEGTSAYERRSRNTDYIKFELSKEVGGTVKYVCNSAIVVARLSAVDAEEFLSNRPRGAQVLLMEESSRAASVPLEERRLFTLAQEAQAHLATVDRRSTVELLSVEEAASATPTANWLAEHLSASGLSQVYCVEEPSTLHLVEAFARSEGMRVLPLDSEEAACFSAIGYAFSSGQPAILAVGSGRSSLKSLPGVALSWLDSVPMVVVSVATEADGHSGQSTREPGPRHVQHVLNGSLFTKATHQYSETFRPEILRYEALRARQGPVWLIVNLMALTQKRARIATSSVSVRQSVDVTVPRPSLKSLNEVRQILQDAVRPVIVLGRGARAAAKSGMVEGLVGSLHCPVVLTRGGKDSLLTEHPLNFGVAGGYGTREANVIVQNSDLLLVLGSSLGNAFTGRKKQDFARSATVISVDIDEGELGKRLGSAQIDVLSDCTLFVHDLTQLLKERPLTSREDWLAQCADWRQALSGWDGSQGEKEIELIKQVSQVARRGTCFVVDAGWVQPAAVRHLRIDSDQSFLTCSGLEEAGFAIPAAIGAYSGSMDSGSCIVITDGIGFASAINSLKVLVAMRHDIHILLLDAGNQTEVSSTRSWVYPGRGSPGSPGAIDVKAISEAVGITLHEIDDDFTSEHLEHLRKAGPSVSRFRIQSRVNVAPRPGFVIDDDGIWHPLPIEDMAPLLPLEVLESLLLPPLTEVSRNARR